MKIGDFFKLFYEKLAIYVVVPQKILNLKQIAELNTLAQVFAG